MSAAVKSLEEDEAGDSDGVGSSLMMRLLLAGVTLCSGSSSSELERVLFRICRMGSGNGEPEGESDGDGGGLACADGCSTVVVGVSEWIFASGFNKDAFILGNIVIGLTIGGYARPDGVSIGCDEPKRNR